jgi:hypothetical protein
MNKFMVFMMVLLACLWLTSAFAQASTGLGQITESITEAATEAESGVLPAMVQFFGFIVTIGFAWAVVKAIRS